MIHARTWTVDIFISEHEDQRSTHAEARLRTEAGAAVRGEGDARRNPVDREVPEIGDELAAARALSDLAHRLFSTAAADVEALAHKRTGVST